MVSLFSKPQVSKTQAELPKEEPAEQKLEPYNDWPNDQGWIGDQDHLTPVELDVTGHVPSYAAGVLYRTGPGFYQIKTDKGATFSCSHWFDGFSQVHRFQILAPSAPGAPSRVLYNSRTTVDKLIEHIRRTGQYNDYSFGQKRDPCQSFFKKVLSNFFRSDSVDANVGVTLSVNMPGLTPDDEPNSARGDPHVSGIRSLCAKTDGPMYKPLDPETLEPKGLVAQDVLHPDLKGPLSAAHAKSDPYTGDVFNYNLELGSKATYRIFRVSASTGETNILATITDAAGAYLHSLALTKNYVILCVWNSFYAYGGMKLVLERNILDALASFDPTKQARWYVIDKEAGGLVATYESEPFFCFHTVNAWEEPVPSSSGPDEVDVVVDLAAYENLDVLKRFYYENVFSTAPASRAYVEKRGDTTRAQLTRWRLPAVTSRDPSRAVRQVRREWTAPRDSSPELPTINPSHLTGSYRYVYGIVDRGKSTLFDGLVKFDTQSLTPFYWERQGHSPGEPIFVPDPEGYDEDDGVLLSVVLDGHSGKSYLLCLNAKTMEELGQAKMNSVVGFGFHGTHVPSAAGAKTHDI